MATRHRLGRPRSGAARLRARAARDACRVTATPLGDAGLASLVDDYAERGWRADDAVAPGARPPYAARGIAAPCRPLRSAVSAVARRRRSVRCRRRSARWRMPGPTCPARRPRRRPAVTVFVDGLRLDVAHRLQDRLAGAGFDVATTTSLAALPTVTADRQAGARPGTDRALGPGPDLHPANVVTGTKASIQVLRGLMAENGVQVLGTTETGDPVGTAWTEAGEIDHRGHDVGVRLVDYLDDEVGPHRRPHPRAARRRMDAGRRRHRPRLDPAPGRHGEGRASGGDDRAQEGALRPAQGRRRSRRRRPCRGSGIPMYASRSPRGRPASRPTRSTSTAASARRSASCPASRSRAGARRPTSAAQSSRR